MHDQHSHMIRLTSAWLPPRDGSGAWVRRFGKPSGIEAGMRVLLVIESPQVAGITLNGTLLTPPATGENRWSRDVTPLLRGRNELSLTPATADADTPTEKRASHGRMPLPTGCGAVALEILTPPGVER